MIVVLSGCEVLEHPVMTEEGKFWRQGVVGDTDKSRLGGQDEDIADMQRIPVGIGEVEACQDTQMEKLVAREASF